MTLTNIKHTDTAEDGSQWVEGQIDGVKLGAFISEGKVELEDFQVWSIGDDLRDAGIDPESDRGQQIIKDWRRAVRAWADICVH